ncbi:DUF1016 N-terminal domain-containing protein [Limnohabitans sp.]|uniref:DUF1016 N-terminal domain-containing protein n=1 Tax=Limnohabitans sp. TaxID=1907725 RepID=UPI0037C14064
MDVLGSASITRLDWTVGQRMARLGRQLSADFGRGFEAKNLRRMLQFVQAFPEPDNVASRVRQLSQARWGVGDAALGIATPDGFAQRGGVAS